MSTSQKMNRVVQLQKVHTADTKKKNEALKKVDKKRKEISSLKQRMSTSKNLNTIKNYQRQIENKSKELVNLDEKHSDCVSKEAKSHEAYLKALEDLRKEEEKQAEKERKREIKHQKEVSREIEKQNRLHRQMSSNPITVNMVELPEKITILFLAANFRDPNDPKGGKYHLYLNEEFREIKQEALKAKHRNSLNFQSDWALRAHDLINSLNENEPEIVHFSGHGSEEGHLLFLDKDGFPQFITPAAISATISTLSNVKLIFFNNCFSAHQAQLAVQHVDVCIGMTDAIKDNTARSFAARFYSSVGFGNSVQKAFDQAVAEIMLANLEGSNIPKLFVKDGIDPSSYYLLQP